MQFSRPLKSSTHSIPSPDGVYIATILPSKLTLRATRSLETTRVIPLPASFSTQSLLWSESSSKVLLSSGDTIRVYSTNSQFSAVIANATSETTKVTSISFGASDDEVCVFSEFGLKLTIFNLSTSKSIDIPSPKFFAGNAARGCACRPTSRNLTLLTRSGGKDVISIHARGSYEVTRSWHPETIDCQGIYWSPDGRWLTVVESAGQGHKILIYTADGHLFKVWNGPRPSSDEEKDIEHGAGVKLVEWNSTSTILSVGDYTEKVTILSVPSFIEILRLSHTATIKPITGLQVWQEHLKPTPSGPIGRLYNLAIQNTCPPTNSSSPGTSEASKTGISILTSDASGTLIATKSESMPTAVWIWDTASKVLQAVLIQHAPIAKATWHPTINELLLIRCQGDDNKGLVHLWEPTWETPRIIDFGARVPEGKLMGKTVVRWLNLASSVPAIFFSDSQDCMLAAITDMGEEETPWHNAKAKAVDIYGQLEESPLNLVPAKRNFELGRVMMDEEPTMTTMSAGSDVDDTFRFKKFVG